MIIVATAVDCADNIKYWKFGTVNNPKPDRCPDETFLMKERYCGDNPKLVNSCRKEGGVIVQFEKNGANYSCSQEVKCKGNEMFDDTCSCKHDTSCFHRDDNSCHVPSVVTLPEGNCKEKDWIDERPEFCSIGTSVDGCKETGYLMALNFVIDRNGKTRFVRKIRIEESQIYDKIDSYIEDKSMSLSGEAQGDESYCKHQPTSKDCYSAYMTDRPYRILKKNGLIPRQHMNTCSEPVYCYGTVSVLVFDKKEMETAMACSGCAVSCNKDNVHIIAPMMGNSHFQICGKAECKMFDSGENIVDSKRSLISKTTDERVKVTMHSEDRRTKFETYVVCPIVGVCKAIDCYWCNDHFLNPYCYNKIDWIVAVFILYAALVTMGLALGFILPACKVCGMIMGIVTRIMIKVVRMVKKLSIILCGGIKKYADDDIESASEMRSVYNRTTYRSNQPSSNLKNSALIFGIMLLILGVSSKAPCSSITVESLSSESCTLKGDTYQCKMASINNIPLVSYDQTTCLHVISPTGSSIGELQVTPYDISFKCSKSTSYYTKDYSMESDHVVRCPHAGQCSEEWCHSVDSDTKVDDLQPIPFPKVQMCKLGDACWGSGCFYCTSSCHTIRYFAKPRTDKTYEVFSCSKWDPSGSIHFRWESGSDVMETTMSLIHGETKQVSNGIKATLEIQVESRLPILSKTYISDGSLTAIVDTAYSGQPVAGQIGQVQCGSVRSAQNHDCVMAPNICVCRPESSDDGCECSQVYINEVFSSSNVLPVSVEDYHIDMERGVPMLKTPAFGSGHIKISSSKKLIGSAIPQEQCSVALSSIDGCYACVSGARVNYTCTTNRKAGIIAHCNGNITLMLDCDNTGNQKTARFQSPSPVMTLSCNAVCSKSGFSRSGVLARLPPPRLTGQGHINLTPGVSREGLADWLSSCWAVLSWSLILYITLGAMLSIIGLVALMRLMSPTVKYVKTL